jgi:hypothetical protein
MADINETSPANENTNSSQQPVLPPEIKAQMEASLNYANPGFNPIQSSEQLSEAAEGAGGQGQAEQQQPANTPFDFSIFKDKYGYETPEAAMTEIETLRQLKNAPPIAPEIEFKGEYSQKIFAALKEGKTEDVYKFLDEQMKLDRFSTQEISKDSAEDIIKTAMRLEYTNLTDEEINYQFNQQYKTPKEPVQKLEEDDDDFKLRKDEWTENVQDINMRKVIAAKMAQPKLLSAKQTLTLPDIQKAADPGYQEYLAYKQESENQQQIDDQTIEAYKAFTPKELKVVTNFKDVANKIDFNFEFEPDVEGFAKAIEMVSDPEKYYASYKNSDGTPNRKKFLEDMYFAQNRDKVIMEAIKQGKNAAIKATLPDNTQGTGMNRQPIAGDVELTDLQKQMQNALGRYMPKTNGTLQNN